MTLAPPLAIKPRSAATPSALLWTAGFAILGFAIWSEGSVSGQDEYRLTFRTPMEMLDRGDLWTPWLNDEPRLQKPPLLYWLIAASYEVLGRNPFAARVWSVVCGVILAMSAARLSRLVLRRDGTLAAWLVVASVGVAIESRRAMLDLPMGALAVAAVSFGIAWLRERRTRDLVSVSICMAASMLFKGPVAMLFILTAGVAGLLARGGGENRPIPWLPLAAGLFGALALALPWPLSMAALWPQLGEVLAEQSEARQFHVAIHESIGPVLGGGLGLLAPWSLIFLHAALRRVRSPHAGSRSTITESGQRWAWTWIVLSAIPFLFMKSFERYLIPMVAPAAILTAAWLEDMGFAPRRRHLSVALVVLGLPVVAFCAMAIWFRTAWVSPALTLIVWALALRVARIGDAPRQVVVMTGLTTALLLGAVYPSLGINSLPALPADLHMRDIATYHVPQPGMLSFRAGRSVKEVFEDQSIRSRMTSFDGYFVVLEDRRERFLSECVREGLKPEVTMEFRSFFSRRQWLKFAREDSQWSDWEKAIRERSLDSLRPLFTCYQLRF
ncbi:MAG: ArnT family glycosyltransferase [Planctomycetota bacterium]